MGEYDHAAAAYTEFVTDESRNADRAELSHAYKYLTQYHLKRDELDQANHYAQKCLQFEETKNEAKAFLKTIAQKRVKIEDNPMMVSFFKTINSLRVPPTLHDQKISLYVDIQHFRK